MAPQEWVGESHTDQPYHPVLARAMYSHAVDSAVSKALDGSPFSIKPGEHHHYSIDVQCLYTPGEANIPDTYDVTATLTDVTASYTTPREETKRRQWWRRGCKR